MWLVVIVLGIVEGLTEFLPISSTGHLILAGHLLSFTGPRADTFEIFIQLGAILAVAWEFRASLWDLGRRQRRDAGARAFVANVALAFMPAAVVGLAAGSAIKAQLFGPATVATALIAGGVAIWLIETWIPERTPVDVEKLTWRQALGVGLAQIAALCPGVSRSAATIMGGMICGLDRRAATEFSFFLALPTLGAATVYDLLKSLDILSRADIAPFALGLLASFVSALLVIRGFLRYVRTHDFRPFAIYRVVLGLLVLAVL
ncbi:MAG: undecaprenyl-diphosphate phosphatase [Candidatus Schekmanbacteria bacterium]|nr:undecaprenyl-diphosphate phosphatase [Candidatus Schekmanbacteria bacterium]